MRNERNRPQISSSPSKLGTNEFYDPNQNKCYKFNGNILLGQQPISSSVTNINSNVNNQQSQHIHPYHHYHHHYQHVTDRNNTNSNGNNGFNNDNSNNTSSTSNNGNVNSTPLAMARERQQHPALISIMNEAQGMKFRGNMTCNIYPKYVVFIYYEVFFIIFKYFDIKYPFHFSSPQIVHIQIFNKNHGFYNRPPILQTHVDEFFWVHQLVYKKSKFASVE